MPPSSCGAWATSSAQGGTDALESDKLWDVPEIRRAGGLDALRRWANRPVDVRGKDAKMRLFGRYEVQIDELTKLAHAIVRESIVHADTEIRLLGAVLDEVKRGIGADWADFPVLGATRAGLAAAKEPVGKNPERYKPVRVGTVFYNPMRILIGSIAMVDEADTPGVTSPDYVVLRGREGVVDSRWFYYWLRSPLGEQCIASLARGAVRERMLFNRLAEGTIELPPYPVQQAASRALAELRPMKAKIEAQLQEIELLPARLLVQVFEAT
jgi:type I restriction enzyme S subunit